MLAMSTVALLFTGCATTDSTSNPKSNQTNLISTSLTPTVIIHNGAAMINPLWQDFKLLPHKRLTRYQAVELDGALVLKADSQGSSSALQTTVDIDSIQTPVLSFSWRADQFAEDNDVSDRNLEDSPVRIIVAFDGDLASLDAKDRAVSDQAKFFTGRALPYATLMYVWSNAQKVEAIVVNPHSRRVRKIVLSNKATPRGQWHHFKRDVVADYERAYGVKPKGRIKAIAVMTDSDNTGDPAVGYYRDIRLSR